MTPEVPNPERRRFIRNAPRALLAGYFILKAVEAGLFTPRLAHADQVIEANGSEWIWSTPYWFPLAEDVANYHQLPRIYNSLAIFDTAYQARYGQPSYAQEWEWDFAEGPDGLLQSLSQEQYNSAGFCHAIANAGMLERMPSEGEAYRPDLDGITYNKVDRLALLAIKHAADMPVDFTYGGSDIEQMLSNYLGDYQTPLVANIPDGQEGNWFRVVYQLIEKDNGALWVRATDLSEDRGRDIEVPASALVSVHYPDHIRGLTEEHLNSKWRNPEVFKDGGILLNDLINY